MEYPVVRKKLKSLKIDVEKGEFFLNDEPLLGVCRLDIEFVNGNWSLLVTRDELYEQAAK